MDIDAVLNVEDGIRARARAEVEAKAKVKAGFRDELNAIEVGIKNTVCFTLVV